MIRVSSGHLQQVFLNIINNAIQAMPDGGVLSIDCVVRDHILELVFTDTGIGISQDNVGHVFDPFFTTKRDGTGLGLSVSFGIVQKHHGDLSVTSTPGHGSTFTVSLPVKAEGRGDAATR
jgi:signal transduction histidine kinase